MKNFLIRILLAAAFVLAGFALASSAQAQQADEDRTTATPQQQPTTSPNTAQREVPARPSADAQTQEALAFTGRVTQEQGHLVLKDPVTKISYQFDDPSKANPYVGKQVKVIGKLELKSNIIHIDSIEPLS